jgi:hypothetical protein
MHKLFAAVSAQLEVRRTRTPGKALPDRSHQMRGLRHSDVVAPGTSDIAITDAGRRLPDSGLPGGEFAQAAAIAA